MWNQLHALVKATQFANRSANVFVSQAKVLLAFSPPFRARFRNHWRQLGIKDHDV